MMTDLQLKKILLLQIFICFCAMHLFAEPTQQIDAQKSEHQKTHDLSFAVSIESVVHNFKQKQAVTIIDVRSSEEYRKIHIPGSVNIPLYSIKTKQFLKANSLVLVNNGYDYGQLEDECVLLKKIGFNVCILWGGLTAWKEKNMEFEGDVFSAKDLNKISPQEFLQEKGYESNIVIDVGTDLEKNEKLQLPDIKHLQNLNEKTLKSLFNNTSQRAFSSILIMNKSGNDYEAYEAAVKKSGLTNVFYLSGGLTAYNNFLQNIALSNTPPETRIKSVNTCSP